MYKILIVDDEIEIRNGLYHFAWGNIGFSAIGRVCNGKEALDFIRNNPVDVVLCDVRMPLIDGLEFARIVHEQQLQLKIVFLSGYNDFEYVRKAMKYGAKDYLLKPTRFKQLVEIFTQIRNELDDELVERFNSESTDRPLYDDRIIQYAIRYIQMDISKISLEKVAKFVHISPQYFCRYFKEKIGVNFSDYLMEQRMKKSSEMLRDSRNKIYEVADKIGYSNPKNFTRAFRAYFGISPSEFRNSFIDNDEVNK